VRAKCVHMCLAPPRGSRCCSAGRRAFFGNLLASFNRQDYTNKELLVIIYIIHV
jgi:hypothetical protein